MKVGDTLTGTVVGMKPYGVFVQLPDDTVGLVHISELKPGFVDDIHQVVKIGQDVTVQVIDIDDYSKKVSFSMRTLVTNGQPLSNYHRFSRNRHRTGFTPLRHQLPIWIEEGMAALRKSADQQN